jgi:rod shape determining protein RodA
LILNQTNSARAGTSFNPRQLSAQAGGTGKGWQQGTQSQLDFLPESHTDFIIAVLSEELGFKGVLILMALYMLIISRCLWISWHAQETFGRLLGSAISITFFRICFC